MKSTVDLVGVVVKKLKEYKAGNEYDYNYDYYYDWVLVDSTSGKSVILEQKRHSDYGSPDLYVKHVVELFGKVDLVFYKNLFKQNPKIFHKIQDLDPVIKFEVFGGQRTKDKLEKALNKMIKAQDEYYNLKKSLYKE